MYEKGLVTDIHFYLPGLPETFLIIAVCGLTIFGVLAWPLAGADPAKGGGAFERLFNARVALRSLGGTEAGFGDGGSASGAMPSRGISPVATALEAGNVSSSVKDARWLSWLAVRHDLALSSPWAGSLVKRRRMDARGSFTRMCWLGIQTLLLTAALCLGSCHPYMASFVVDDYAVVLKIVVLVSAAASFALAFQAQGRGSSGQRNVNQATPTSYEFVLLALFAVAGLLVLISAYDLLVVYLAVELQSLSLYVLAAMRRNSEFSTEAGLKYFVLGALSSGFLLFGSAFIYGFTGTIRFEELYQLSLSARSVDLVQTGTGDWTMAFESFGNPGLAVGILFFSCGLFFKLAAVPFHMWAPDVYEGAPTLVTAFFAIVPKVAVVALCCRVFFHVFYGDPLAGGTESSMFSGAYSPDMMFSTVIQPLLVVTAVSSMLVGCIGGLYQTKLKRLLAYSAIGHVGYILLAMVPGSVEGVQAVFLYLFLYLVSTLCIFAVLMAYGRFRLSKAGGGRSSSSMLSMSSGSGSTADSSDVRTNQSTSLVYLTDLAFLGKANPSLALCFGLSVFSMAGIPPLAGFFGKYYLFYVLVSEDMYLLALIGVLTSVVSCFYYLRMVKLAFFTLASGEGPKWPQHFPVSGEHGILLASCVIVLLGFIFYPGPLFLVCHKLALVFCV
jgi:NADH-quinone oxidoreductase subunit N